MRRVGAVEFPDNLRVWRYMRTSRFLGLLEGRSIHFASANQFEDRFEGAVAVLEYGLPVDPRYTEMDHAEQAFQELKRLTKICCWHIEDHESAAMWNLYSDMGKGIAITSTPARIAKALKPYRIQPEFGSEDLRAGPVVYVNLLQERLRIGMLERFFVKHDAFSWEKEFRLAISVRTAEEFGVPVPEAGIFVEAEPNELIEEVFLGPTLDSDERETIFEACREHRLDAAIKVTSLLGTPRYV